MPAYNALEHLRHTLPALERQDLPPSLFEVIVVNDASTDGTAEYLTDYKGALDLKVINNARNLGRAKTRNLGLKSAQNPLIAFLDADVEVRPDYLRLHREAQMKEKQVLISRLVFHPELAKSGLMRYLEKRGAYRRKTGENLPGKYFLSGVSSVPKETLVEVGGFDENFTNYGGEDLELGIKLAEKLPLRYLPSALCYHRHYRELGEMLKMVRGYGEYSLPYLFEKHPEIKSQILLDASPPRSLKDILIALVCSTPVYATIRAGEKLAFKYEIVYNYLIYRNYRAGYYAYLQNQNIEANVSSNH
jgi:glycosyltransferase involved in cell wall biosynthesis